MLKQVRAEAGVHVLLASFLIAVCVILAGLVLGIAMLTASKARLQNVANLAALAAIERFLQEPALAANNNFAGRSSIAITHAGDILTQNKLPGTLLNLAGASATADPNLSGQLSFGRWFNENDGSNPCTRYPCFVTTTAAMTEENKMKSNAVRVTLRNQAGNYAFLPFARAFGAEQRQDVDAQAIASVAERCTLFLLDLSFSTNSETHRRCLARNPPDPTGWKACTTPRAGYFAYKKSKVKDGFGNTLGANCTDWTAVSPPPPSLYNRELEHYCIAYRNGARTSAASLEHYYTDYVEIPIWVGGRWETYLIDTYVNPTANYRGPEPLSRFFLAFNAALREMAVRSSSADRAGMLAFEANARDMFPIGSLGMLREMGSLIQLTNFYNLGARTHNGVIYQDHAPARHPNFADRGWLPVEGLSDTNILQALYLAIERLHGACPARSRKSIVLATDGLINCRYRSTDTPGAGCSGDTYKIDSGNYDHYAEAEQWLLGGGYVTGAGSESVLDLARRREVAITVMLDGASVQPNIIYRRNPAAVDCDKERCFLTSELARAFGVGGFTPASGGGHTATADTRTSFFDISSVWPATEATQTDAVARNKAIEDRPGYLFRRPNGLFGRLALDSGGVFCPLMPPDPDASHYAGTPGNRFYNAAYLTGKEDQRFDYSPENLSKSEQAVNCARQALGQSPYILVTEQSYLPSPPW